MGDQENENSEIKLAQAKAIELASKADLRKIESEEKKREQEAKIISNRDDKLYNAHIAGLEAKKYIVDKFAKDNTKKYILIGIISLFIIIFLIICVITKQISFFIPFFKDLTYILAGAFGGYGIGRHSRKVTIGREDKNNV